MTTPTFADGMEAAAKIAEAWTSSLHPGNEHRLKGHREAAHCIAAAIRAAKTKEGDEGVKPSIIGTLLCWLGLHRWQAPWYRDDGPRFIWQPCTRYGCKAERP